MRRSIVPAHRIEPPSARSLRAMHPMPNRRQRTPMGIGIFRPRRVPFSSPPACSLSNENDVHYPDEPSPLPTTARRACHRDIEYIFASSGVPCGGDHGLKTLEPWGDSARRLRRPPGRKITNDGYAMHSYAPAMHRAYADGSAADDPDRRWIGGFDIRNGGSNDPSTRATLRADIDACVS